MDSKRSKRYQALSEGLKDLFKELVALEAENQRLTTENITLREEVSLLRLYIDTYSQAGEDTADLEKLDLLKQAVPPEAERDAEAAEERPHEETDSSALTPDAIAFFNSLPQSFNFSELFELADLLGIEKDRMKGFMTTYLRENLMEQHGTRVEKTGEPDDFWERSLGQVRKPGARRDA